ncbi:hypothetical protein CHUAL_006473 [Chamberlinius hualienensis]
MHDVAATSEPVTSKTAVHSNKSLEQGRNVETEEFVNHFHSEITQSDDGNIDRRRRSYRDRLKRWKQSILRNTCATVRPADSDSVVDGADIPPRVLSYDDLSILSRSQLPQGKVAFLREFDYEAEGRPYVRVHPDSPIDEVNRVLQHDWKMAVPTIVLEIIASVSRGSPAFESHRQWTNLQDGIIGAANKTNMWIITHGFNTGIAKTIGDIVHKENERREAATCYRHPKQSGPKLPKLTLMGIVKSSLLSYDDLLDGKNSRIEIQNEGNYHQENKYELNADHTHFMMVSDMTYDGSGLKRFISNLASYLRQSSITETSSFGGVPIPKKCEKVDLAESSIPLIALFIGGGNKSTLMVLDHLKKQIPVVVVKGSGGAADLLAFAYEEIKEQSRGTWDPEYIETFVMSELSKKIAIQFAEYRENNLARNKFRDAVLECIRHSTMGDQSFLSFVDIHSNNVDLSKLNQHLLKALFKAEKRDVSDVDWYYNIQKDLRLTLDWNCPHIAKSEVFAKSAKVKIEKKVFEQALMRQDREAFVDLFLNQGFQIHKYLNEKHLARLYEKSENPEFFRNVCLEGALGYSFSLKLDKQFLKRDLNWLIKYFTKLKNFVDAQDLTSNAMGAYACDIPVAERIAHRALILWSVLFNRPKLAKMLWKRSDHPIHMALLISLLYRKIVEYVKEKHLIKELEDRSKEFADMAVGVLDASFQTSNCRAFDILSDEIADWNYKTAVELAAIARNRKFIAHPCCQKWLTYLYMGDIRIRELKFGLFTVSPWIKVVTSAIFIIPMYFWIHFRTGQKRSVIGIYDDGDNDECSENESDNDTISQPPLSRMCSREGRVSSFPMANFEKVKYEELPTTSKPKKSRTWHLRRFPKVTFFQYLKPRPQPPLWTKIALMWNAPITKFWTHQIFYILYLALFSLCVIWPSWGNFWLDVAVWFWTFLIYLENCRVVYIQFRKYQSIPLGSRIIEQVLITIFLILFLTVRILKRNEYTPFDLELPPLHISPYTARVIMCLGLLYFYYRFIWIYFPISPTLGPLLYRIRLMVMEDFVHFLRLALLFIISSGIVIHSVIYPDYPISKELFRRVFHKAWFTLFLTPISDLEVENRCGDLVHNESVDTTTIGKYDDYSCPTTGVWPYVMTIQYHIILKLILLTLLYALFRETGARKVAAQRASGDTAATTASDADSIWRYQRYHLVLDFMARFRLPPPLNAISFVLHFFQTVFQGMMCKQCKKSDLAEDNSALLRQLKEKTNDYNYWRGLAMEYSKKQEDKDKEKDLNAKQLDCIRTIGENVEYQKAYLYKLKVRLTELEKLLLTSRISLEDIKHTMAKDDVKVSGGSTTVHLFARQSPYPDTRVQRFPLVDRYVPWEWNFVFTNVAGITVDRTSWIKDDDDKNLIYKLDSGGLPINPAGRTGLRGRGSLHRWGPNHAIILVLTRWRTRDGFLQSVHSGSGSDDHKMLEFVIYRRPGEKLLRFPGGFMYDGDTPNNLIRNLFAPDASESWDEEKMRSFARTKTGDFVDIVGEESQEFDMESFLVLRGYMDDTLNTDNAWVEAEIWHYHYTANESADLSNLSYLKWKAMSRGSNLDAKMVPSHAALLNEIQQRKHSGLKAQLHVTRTVTRQCTPPSHSWYKHIIECST